MMKYSTYRSIYDEAQKVEAVGQISVSDKLKLSREITGRLVDRVLKMFKQDQLVKLSLIILLVVSGFTVVGNVFAGSVSLMKQEKRVVVERGDTLWSIALENKPTDMKTAVYIEGIKRSSGLEDSNIKAGDIITLPIY
ncbi:LysM peptidoglycan-binding domain-containing protein [Paenibacillus sp. 19GGS1-52]|uniref:LysM peptidoglycan-binding domain-containing protein n=1 Tax=Paenibacillus sp. 19GGS1-52 TaxID=2758563 RepID=UPI001EFBCA10|nr:LysM peptidoglycan-binding domain-containing protein [Paenibacillus sp. 19GGS1-52]ULO10001.1 LysM peptidoglycan-binding domain-containing protein [Paenibacillus sp. 19GGS1-52]